GQQSSSKRFKPEGHVWETSYPPLSVGVSPNSVHSPTDMSRELRTVTTAARARPHLDFTMSILPVKKEKNTSNWIVSCRGRLTETLKNKKGKKKKRVRPSTGMAKAAATCAGTQYWSQSRTLLQCPSLSFFPSNYEFEFAAQC
uniref:Uncharacterized protein n=1 Tax=Stegastes partitus TaxID=144197 RepID=A0A3B5B9X1_9TELE